MIAAPGAPSPVSRVPGDDALLARAAAHLRALAVGPRPSGSLAAADGRRYASGVLESLGYQVAEKAFEYSAAIGELATPAGGLAVLLVIGAAAGAALGGHPVVALVLLVVGVLLVAMAGRWLARRGILALPIARRRGVNVEANVSGIVPRVWFVAHIDSKSQPVSLMVRAAGIVLLLVAWLSAAGAAVGEAFAGRDLGWWGSIMAVALIGAIPVIASVVGRRSPGAVDNASGVATVLAAAELCVGLPVGVLITDAEELGLAGARAWCSSAQGERAPILNCDGVDDVGVLTLMWTRPRATRLERAVRRAAEEARQPLRVISLIPGVLVDGVAFSDAGWECVTVSRGSIATLRRIHTRRDDLERLTGSGVAIAARVLASAAREITEQR